MLDNNKLWWYNKLNDFRKENCAQFLVSSANQRLWVSLGIVKMTDAELKKLSRVQLLELLLALREEADKLEQENCELRENLAEAKKVSEELSGIIRRTAAGVAKLCGGKLPDSGGEVDGNE